MNEQDFVAQLIGEERHMQELLAHITTAVQRIRDQEAQQADEERRWALNREAEAQREGRTA